MKKDMYNLTFPQENILFMERYNSGSAVNVISGLVNINKEFSVEKCNDAINSVIKKNDIMRARICENSGKFYQYIEKYEYEEFEVIDMSSMSKDEILEWIDGMVFQPLFSYDEKLYDFKILKYNLNSGSIFMKVNHIISDAWSCSKIGTQLVNVLENNLDDEEKPSYIEFINSENEYKNSEKFKKDSEFWKEYLHGVNDTVSLKEKNSNLSTKAQRYSVKLEKEINDKIINYCKENRISPYALFLAAVSTYIYRIKDKNDFVLGTPVLNRSNFKEKQMLGMFVSTLPLRVKIEEGEKFLDLTKKIGKDTLSVFRHQKYPYMKTLEYIRKNSDITSNLYNIVLSYQNARTELLDHEKYSTTWNFSKELQDDLQIHIMDMDSSGILNINYDYKVDLFDKIEIEYLHTRMLAIIENALNDLDVNVEDIRIMSKEEENKILYEFNDTKRDYRNYYNVLEIFNETVRKNLNNVAIVFEGNEFTYDYLDKESDKLAYVLKNKYSVSKNSIVALLFERCPEMIISILGVLKSGAAYLPIDPSFPKERIEYMVSNSNANMIISNSPRNRIIKNNELNVVYYENVLENFNENTDKINMNINKDDNAYIIYTSGTTGKPKGTVISHGNLINFIEAYSEKENINSYGTAISLAKYSFDMFIIDSIIPIFKGLKLILANENESIMPHLITKLIKYYSVEVLSITPSKLDMILEYSKNKELNSLKNVTMGGEVFNKKCFEILKSINHNIKVFNAYGPTEITVASSLKNVTQIKNGVVSIGEPLPNVRVLILDKKKRMLPIGVTGEQYIFGKGVCKGYLNNEPLTLEKFLVLNGERTYNSGDLVFFDFNGDLYYVGRGDNQVKINGLRIELEEIEKQILNIDFVRNCAVLIDEMHGKQQLFAYIILKEDLCKENDIKNILIKKLPLYMVPNYFIYLSEFPINSSGKINKNELKKYKPSIEKTKSKVVVKNKNQVVIKDIVCKILDINDIDLNSSFFEHGMDSLDAIKIASELSINFNVELHAKNIFENNSIILLDNYINESRVKDKKILISVSNESKYDGCYPLTAIQKGLFSIYSQNPESITYNTPFELKLDRNINVIKLKQAITKVIKSHEVFGYRIVLKENGELFQKYNQIKDSEIIKIEKIPYLKYKIKRKNFVKPFDLLNDKLFRINIYETEENVYILFDFSHIIFDGASIYIFINEIYNEYGDKVVTKDKISFGEVCKKNTGLQNINEYVKAKEFFINQFKGELPINNFITDTPRPSQKSFRGESVKFVLVEKYYNQLQNICKKKDITVNSFLLGIFNIVLSKYMYSEDIIIGLATSGRKNEKELKTIGMFIKTLPFRTKINYQKTILDFLKDIQNNLINTIDNSMYSYDELLKELNIIKDVSRNPLFDIMYVYQNEGNKEIDFNGCVGEISAIDTHTSKFDLTCEIMPNISKDFLNINFEYSTDIFNRSSIEDFGKHYLNAIEYVINHFEGGLSDIQLVTELEKRKLLIEFNNNKTDYHKDKSVHQIFEQQAKLYPEKKAVVYKESYLTYSQLNEKANILARFLLDKGIKSGDIVALLLDKSIEYLVGALAVIKCNAAYVAITNDLPIERAKYMITNSNSKIVLTSKKFFREIIDLPCYYIDIDSKLYDVSDSKNKQNLNLPTNSEMLLHVIYTSGSTGIPKGNMIKHKGMLRLLLNTNYISFNSSDIMLTSSSLTFDTSGFEIWGAMMYGMTLHMMEKDDILNLDYYSRYICNNDITVTFIPTPIFHQMVENNYLMFKGLKYIYVGGDVLLPKYTNIMYEKLPKVKVYNAYGPAEITVICCAQLIEKIYTSDIPLGKVVSNNNVYILDKCQNVCPINCPGELYVSGDGLGMGYINRDDLTKEKFIFPKDINELTYRSGDLTLWNSLGEVRYISRIDSQLKIRGQRVEILEIQNRMLMLKEIKEVALKVIVNKNGTQYLIAYFTVNGEIDISKIKKYLSVYLPVYMIPYRFVKIDKMPLNQNGKIDKLKLPEIDLNEEVEMVSPENKIQENILNVFKKVLKNNNIGMKSDFFENGGDSLMVIRLISELNLIGENITYSNVFSYKTPLDIYKLLYEKKEKESISEGLEYINYKKINEMLIKNKCKKDIKISARKNLENVLITGITGFLGIHVLKELIDEGVNKVYCLVRKKDGIDIVQRTKEKLEFFFSKNELNEINNKIEVLEGDITNSHIFLNDVDYEKVVDNIGLVINCAASVKHYGKFEKFYDINVRGTQNIIKFCIKNNKELVHISTLSVSGNIIEGGQIIQKNIDELVDYDETKLYIGQNLDNVYAYTKFMAEKYVCDAIINDNLKGKIIRMGNLTGRFSDGKFQPNVSENAFANRIKTIVNMKIMPENMLGLYLEMTPIDYAAKAVVKISKLNEDYTVFHVFNDKHAMMPFVIDVLKKVNINLKILSVEETKKIIKKYLNDNTKINEIEGIIADINEDGMIEYNDNIKIRSDFTKSILKNMNFEWPKITEEYFLKYLEYLRKIGFLEY